ncbi:MAG: hypothetical protein H3C34_00165 [Caldilineaceae bacterium]|nr:hypothetical protein [Caldilineaceae bacterium]
MERVKKRRHASTPRARWDVPLIVDLLQTLELIRADGTPDPARLEGVIALAAASEYLIDEPEFDAIGLPPLEAMAIYIRTADEMGIKPEDLDKMSEVERSDMEVAILNALIEHYHDDLMDPLLEALSTVRAQAERAGDSHLYLDASATMLALAGQKDLGLDMMPGLVYALVWRSVEAGFAVASVAVDLVGEEAETLPFSEVLRRLHESDQMEALNRLAETNPVLRRYVDEQLDDSWNKGIVALYTGELYLDLFTDEQRERGAAIVRAVAEIDGMLTDLELSAVVFPHLKEITRQLRAYLQEEVLPERLPLIMDRLEAVANGRYEADREWLPFIMELLYDLKTDTEGIQSELVFALYGEIWPLIILEDADGESGDDDLF